ncbi:Putative uncharacterized protein [Thermobacillus xylanilyticus]|jgi:hypothetical protein|uniref:DUF4242 domain-containing protein n=1 Tax=Thermobacillus xylanilyticus TaxID=76633 RepID=A0ABM8V8R7_THEXY|nr:DUF4242 domain-containing protein [Thermobacillus xylanilyticus]CAG5092223.1 Putative uncharacterized protein [Thermobacillus xylanilyticus]
MTLFLVESVLGAVDRTKFQAVVSELQSAAEARGVRLIEVQAAADHTRAFFILEGESRTEVAEAFRGANVPIALIKPVRLIGKDVRSDVDARDVNYLVEWNIPEGLTMEQYLERKKTNSVYYSEVPEVEFSRTYVCEDMTKCLCFYKAPDESAVKRAREAVRTPIDSITKLSADA